MSCARVYGAQPSLLDAHIITVEADTTKGLHAFSVVGLPDKAVEEARDRVGAAIKNSGLKSPKQKNQKTIISLAPADIRKEGPVFDVPIALAYLLASKDIEFNPEQKLFLGELALDGSVRPIKGVLPIVWQAKQAGFREVFVPEENKKEAAFIDDITIYGVGHLSEILEHFREDTEEENTSLTPVPHSTITPAVPRHFIDMSDIKGQETAKRGLEIAAAGGHNIALYGPPGTGKTMLAKAFTGILPSLSSDDVFAVTAIHSVAGSLEEHLVTEPPFRAPHHTASYASLIGGGTAPKPGEVTLAHKGVLFLDEFPEFDKRVIESLRQPLEEGEISISRSKGTETFPSDFILIAAMNPCPCGFFGDQRKECVCTPAHLASYRRKISGPIMDRIDMWIEVPRIDHGLLADPNVKGEESARLRTRIQNTRGVQKERYAGVSSDISLNSQLGAKQIASHVRLQKDVEEILEHSARKLDLSARAYHRIIKLARTIADIEGELEITEAHILEALGYRPKDPSVL